MARVKDLTGFELMSQFERVHTNTVNYPNNKTYAKQLVSLEKELAKRLGVSETELKEIQKV